MLQPHVFFDLSGFAHAALFDRMAFVWQAIPNIGAYARAQLTGAYRPAQLGVVAEGAHLINPELIYLGEGSVIEHTVMMGADYYDKKELPGSDIAMGVGRDCFIRNAIIDKNARIGDGCYITPDGKDDVVTDLYTVQDGVIVIPKNAVIPPGTRI